MKVKGIAFSGPGCSTLKRISETLGDGMEAVCRTKADSSGIPQTEDVDAWVREGFEGCDALVFVGATGIAVRYIAPYVRGKDRDPAVVCVDERGRFCIPLLSGHLGGANRLAEMIAEGIGAVPVITTATDINGVFAVDTFAKDNDLRIGSLEAAKEVSAALLRGDAVRFRSDIPIEGDLPSGLIMGDEGALGISISADGCRPYGTTLLLTPMDVTVGVGCRRGTDPEKLRRFVMRILEEEGISPGRVGSVRSIDIKRDEEAVLRLAESLDAPARFLTAEELMKVEGDFTPSDFVRERTGVDNVCERSAAWGGCAIKRRKTVEDGMTVAIGMMRITPRF